MQHIVRHSTHGPRQSGAKRKFACLAKSAAQLGQERDWRQKVKPIKQGGTYPAKEFCSNCGLCDTYYVAHVKDACAFLGSGL